RLERRAAELRPGTEIVDAGADHLPFPDASFDTAVVTLVLCSVPDQQAALAEIARVVEPGGRLLFLQHVPSDDPKVAKWQGPARRIYHGSAGCNPNRATAGAIEASPFEVESLKHGEVPKAPKIERPMIVGVARRSPTA